MTSYRSITRVGVTSATSTDGSNVVVTKPTDVGEGDVLVAFGCSNEGAFSTLPSGFTQFGISTDADTTNNFRAYGWYKICGNAEPSTYTFGSTTASGAGAPIVIGMAAYRGCDIVGSPILNFSYDGTGTIAEPANFATSFTQSGQGRLLFVRAVRGGTTVGTFTNGTGAWTEILDDGAFSGGTVSYAMTLVESDVDTGSGSRSEPQTTCSISETDNVAFLLVLEAGVLPYESNLPRNLGVPLRASL